MPYSYQKMPTLYDLKDCIGQIRRPSEQARRQTMQDRENEKAQGYRDITDNLRREFLEIFTEDNLKSYLKMYYSEVYGIDETNPMSKGMIEAYSLWRPALIDLRDANFDSKKGIFDR